MRTISPMARWPLKSPMARSWPFAPTRSGLGRRRSSTMYLSDRDLEFAVRTGQLIVDPAPAEYDTTSIDLYLDSVEKARVWDVKAFEREQEGRGIVPALLAPG